MRIIKLNAIDSTNSYLKKLVAETNPEDYTVVVTATQESGRGQMGTVWQSEPGKNLTCSVFKRTKSIALEDNFIISMVVSIALIKTLEYFQIPKLNIKWPNDILSEQKKICGILIENVIKSNTIEATIIGIGSNVNQIDFPGLPRATSMQLLRGKSFEIDEVLQKLMENLKIYFSNLKLDRKEKLKAIYLSLLFRKDKPSTFADTSGNHLTGIIKGVSSTGHLEVLLEDEVIRYFNFKEIELLY